MSEARCCSRSRRKPESKTLEEIEADRESAQLEYEEKVEDFNEEKEAIAAGEDYKSADEGETETVSEETAFDSSKDVENSTDYVISFVMSAGDSEMDQQVLFLVSAAAWSILNPKYNNTDDSFAFLWKALFTTYNYSGGLSASTIDGIDNSYSFSIPGNGVEAWLGTNDAGEYILAITLYVSYDEIIDIAGSSGSGLQSAMSGLYG